MKKFYLLVSIMFIILNNSFSQLDIEGKITEKLNQKANQNIDNEIDKGLDEAENGIKDSSKKKEKKPKQTAEKNMEKEGLTASVKKGKDDDNPSSAALKAYSNYDFIPGEKILFEDNFADSEDGEFPPHWNLINGQGVVNKSDGSASYVCVEGNLGSMHRIEPAMKTKTYLGSSYTIEFDFLIPNEDGAIAVYLKDKEGDEGRFIWYEPTGIVKTGYFSSENSGVYSGDPNGFVGKWHHACLAYKNQQFKCYVDQYRVLVIPKAGFEPVALMMGFAENSKMKNMKLAEGGGMNMLGKILTDGKIVTHAIKFDVNKSVIKAESMGFLNELAKWMKEKGDVKLEIIGHTDSDGDDKVNMKLSESRAEAVKNQLVSMGVSAVRFSTKGMGETQAIDNNTSVEGKANNRRVEFVKIN